MPRKSNPPAERRGRPPAADPMSKRALVRYSRSDEQIFKAEVQRLTEVSGARWTISGYLRFAGLRFAGQHLGSGA